MTGVQRKTLVDKVRRDPKRPLDEAIEEATTGPKYIQIIVTLNEDTDHALKQFAHGESVTKDAAAFTLIHEALVSRGLLRDDS